MHRFPRFKRPGFVCVVAALFCIGVSQGDLRAQQSATVASPAVNLLTGSLGALTGGGAAAQDVVLTGNVAVTANGQTTQGTIRLVSNVAGMTRTEIDLASGNQVETRRIAAATPAGELQVGSAAVTTTAMHNLMVDPSWFFPEHLVSRAAASTRPATVLAAVAMDGTTAVGVDSYLAAAASNHAATLRQVSELTAYFDQTTLLPVEIQYNSHENDSLLKIIPVRIVYSNYQTVQGHMVPFHIQRYEKTVLVQDITLTAATFNSGVVASQYSLN